jgi:small subunit ribosomal protein S5
MTRESRSNSPREPRGNQGLEDKVIKIRRCAAVVKGGRRFSFNALVVVGDRQGNVGWGYGKANEVPPAVEKAVKEASRSLNKVSLEQFKGTTTIPHSITGKFGATKVIMAPAGPGTGVKAGPGVREVLELAGVRDILTKVHGSSNALNLVKATLDGLKKLRSKEQIKQFRGI